MKTTGETSKTIMPANYPFFRRDRRGRVSLTDSIEAMTVEKKDWKKPPTSEEIESGAIAQVRSRGGDILDRKDVLGEYIWVCGRYNGRCFRWMLENVPGYVGWFVGDVLNDDLKKVSSNASQEKNKEAIVEYMTLFTEAREVVKMKISQRKSSQKLKTQILEEWDSRLPREHNVNVNPSLESMDSDDDMSLISCMEQYDNPATVQASSKNQPLSMLDGNTSSILPVSSAASTRTPTSPTTTTANRKTAPSQTIPTTTVPAVPTSVITSSIQSNVIPASTSAVAKSLPGKAGGSKENTTNDFPLSKGWRDTLPKVDQKWVSKLFFSYNINDQPEFMADRVDHLWYSPVLPSVKDNIRNKYERYFAHRIFMWMPANIWNLDLRCPHEGCKGYLTRAGVHKTTRLVLDIDGYYNIATENLKCNICKKVVVPWSTNIIQQMSIDRQMMFPCILTAKYACDIKVVERLRERSLGNSSSMILNKLVEAHSNKYLRDCHHYLTTCQSSMKGFTDGFTDRPKLDPVPKFIQLPDHRWLMKIYQLDVLSRQLYIKAAITSTFGDVLKMDSTKKITKKLAGRSSKSAMWATNVGNEHGQVIMSVLTTDEGQGLINMINGIMRRYRLADVTAPRLLYVDRDCCDTGCVGKYFEDWPFLLIRLDIWHFMRRFSNGVTSDAHPLFGTLMSGLSRCIFQWDEDDLSLLKRAKREEMLLSGIPCPTDADVARIIKGDELSLHCRRMTRGTTQTTALISELIQSLSGDNGLDTMGIPLIDKLVMTELWKKQSRHVSCIQDPAGLHLYRVTGSVKKGKTKLPTYRCARGSTSLESFHLHMNRFIPGTLASDMNFQVYLLDGLFRWNENRRRSATTDIIARGLFSYDGPIQQSCNALSLELFGEKLVPDFQPPGKYTGELIGIEYLNTQSSDYSIALRDMQMDPHLGENAVEDDSGISNIIEVSDLTVPDLVIPAQPGHVIVIAKPTLQIPTSEEYEQMVDSTPAHDEAFIVPRAESSETDESDLGPDNIPGYQNILKLAEFLVSLHEQITPMSTTQINDLLQLWSSLSKYDRKKTFPERFTTSIDTSRFKKSKKQVAPGVASMKKQMLQGNTGPCTFPDVNRYVEATVSKLLEIFTCDKRSKDLNVSQTRWSRIISAYGNIQKAIQVPQRIKDKTDIVLPKLNSHTVRQWYHQREKAIDLNTCLQGVHLPSPPMAGKGAPAPLKKPTSLHPGAVEPFEFALPKDTAGMFQLKVRKRKLVKILPKPTMCQAISIGSGVPTSNFSNESTPIPNKRKNTPAKIIMCKACKSERIGPSHQQYCGYRHCGATATVSYDDWKADLQAKQVHLKKKRV